MAGSYEGQLVGFSLDVEALEVAGTLHPTPLFAFKAHTGCIRAAGAAGEILVTSSSDNTISLYNLRRRRAQGALLQEGGGGAVHSFAFYAKSHLLSAGEDGDVCIWRVSDWECLLRMKGHRSAVEHLAVHPSGRLALSACREKKLRLWNLLSGKCNYTSTLPEQSRVLEWSPEGDAYIVSAGKVVRVHTLVGEGKPLELCHDREVLVATHASDSIIVTGDADGQLHLWDRRTATRLGSPHRAHESRLKAMAKLAGHGVSPLLVTASSDGYMRLWRLVVSGGKSVSLDAVAQMRTGLRLTCVSASIVTHGKATLGQAQAQPKEADVMRADTGDEGIEDEGEALPFHADQHGGLNSNVDGLGSGKHSRKKSGMTGSARKRQSTNEEAAASAGSKPSRNEVAAHEEGKPAKKSSTKLGGGGLRGTSPRRTARGDEATASAPLKRRKTKKSVPA